MDIGDCIMCSTPRSLDTATITAIALVLVLLRSTCILVCFFEYSWVPNVLLVYIISSNYIILKPLLIALVNPYSSSFYPLVIFFFSFLFGSLVNLTTFFRIVSSLYSFRSLYIVTWESGNLRLIYAERSANDFPIIIFNV